MAGISIHSIGRASSWWAPGIETGAVEGAWIWTVTDVDVWSADRAGDSSQSATAGWLRPALSTRARPHPANRLRPIEAPAPPWPAAFDLFAALLIAGFGGFIMLTGAYQQDCVFLKTWRKR